MHQPPDNGTFRRVLGHLPTGVVVVTASSAGVPHGLAIGSFTSVSLDPPLIGFFPAKTSRSWPAIEAAGRFCVNVLDEDQQDLSARFAARDGDRFAGVTWRRSPSGSPILAGVHAWIDCVLDEVTGYGDHWFVSARVTALGVERGHGPLVFYQGGYARLVSGDPVSGGPAG
ncbi:flavin reductase family protein [Actinomadura sp. 9N407]|uniref:flavin reductase family protein n=1 Tax=Actinomadura sp. 9N407 TaxID=3375154 RepID=UPI00378FB4EE